MGRRSFGSETFERFSPVLWWSKAYPGRWYVDGDYYEDRHRARPRPKKEQRSRKGRDEACLDRIGFSSNKQTRRKVSKQVGDASERTFGALTMTGPLSQ